MRRSAIPLLILIAMGVAGVGGCGPRPPGPHVGPAPGHLAPPPGHVKKLLP